MPPSMIFPARTNGSFMISSSADEVDDFELVAFRQCACFVLLARHDGAIDLHGDAPLSEPQLNEQMRNRRAFGEAVSFAVDEHTHG